MSTGPYPKYQLPSGNWTTDQDRADRLWARHEGNVNARSFQWRVCYARTHRAGPQPRHIAAMDMSDPGNVRKLRLDKTLCGVWAAAFPESGAQGELSAATCRACIARHRKLAS